MGKDRPSIGLALGSGGARGLAHIGVIEAFEKHDIPIDFIAGSSMGALVGCLYGVGQGPEQMKKMATMFKRKYYLDFIVPKMGFLSGQRIRDLIYHLTKKRSLEDAEIPVWVVATDLINGEAVVLQEGLMADAIRASISIPGVFVPVKQEGRLLVDGGVVDRVPAQIVKKMGADITVAVDVSFNESPANVSSIYDVMMQSMDIMAKQLLKHTAIEADMMIRPISKSYHSLVFDHIDELVAHGKEAAEQCIPKIKEKVEGWKENHHENE